MIDRILRGAIPPVGHWSLQGFDRHLSSNTFSERGFDEEAPARNGGVASHSHRRGSSMTKLKLFAFMALLSLPLAVAGCSHPRPVMYVPPPPAWSAVAQQGYHDGFFAARHDIRHGLAPNLRRHPRFRNPPVPPPMLGEYRHGFRAGYQQAIHGGQGPGY
ncbi:MAG: hypothetical protein ACP5E2_09680 [Terracidiphilus sp.]